MKKLIAILAVFSLLTTAVFAQTFSAGGAARAFLLQGNSEEDDPTTGFESWFWMSAEKTNDENTMGAKGAFSIDMGSGSLTFDEHDGSYFYAWWRPIQQVFMKVGKIGEDGNWSGADMAGWGLHSNDLLINPDFDYYNGYAGQLLPSDHGFFDTDFSLWYSLQLSFFPFTGLAIHTGFELDGGTAESVYVHGLTAQVSYAIPDVGEAAITFRNGPEGAPKHLYAQWSMPINDMSFEIGLHYQIVDSDAAAAPLNIGLGFRYGNAWGDDFWLSARIGAAIGMEDGDSTTIGVDIVPSIELGIFRLYVPVGLGIVLPDEGDALVAWNFSPYIRRQMGGLEFWAGLILYNGPVAPWAGSLNDGNSDQVNWKIPVGLLWAW
jgi:hypothetical protein